MNYTFNSKADRNKHDQLYHSEETSERKKLERNAMVSHRKKQAAVTVLVCRVKRQLNGKEEKDETKEKEAANICGEKFSSRYTLAKHLRERHEGVKNPIKKRPKTGGKKAKHRARVLPIDQNLVNDQKQNAPDPGNEQEQPDQDDHKHNAADAPRLDVGGGRIQKRRPKRQRSSGCTSEADEDVDLDLTRPVGKRKKAASLTPSQLLRHPLTPSPSPSSTPPTHRTGKLTPKAPSASTITLPVTGGDGWIDSNLLQVHSPLREHTHAQAHHNGYRSLLYGCWWQGHHERDTLTSRSANSS